ncbi:hypothetical protein [Pedobacter sp. BMA]|uniref:hypothetical protein n=1 Tax=Pedobacter sp. BMA TaxID=1663685 RepID=UPI0006495CB4|nr:hypothetical protein [Pedobacter sp. BMA]KLT66634.1 hypothetical protein AB669_05530 [Pedobacter sp. BMA]
MAQAKRNVITIATNKRVYLELAINLARSFYIWNRDNDIGFYLVTDMGEHLPADIKRYVNVIAIKENELGTGFSTKLHLDKLAPEGQTLFIDSDCLIFGSLNRVFDKFSGHQVSVIGNYIKSGEWFGNIADICSQFEIPHLPKFNGGIYYLEKGSVAEQVYSKARELERTYDQIGFKRLRNSPNDEVLMSLSMQLNGQSPIIDDGTILSDPQACPGYYKINVTKGTSLLINPKAPHKLHQSWYPFHIVKPLVVHFVGYYTDDYQYKYEAYKLSKMVNNKLSVLTNMKGLITINWAGRLKIGMKNVLRPVFRKAFGTRKIKISNRVS